MKLFTESALTRAQESISAIRQPVYEKGTVIPRLLINLIPEMGARSTTQLAEYRVDYLWMIPVEG
jgi:hypothetical protein